MSDTNLLSEREIEILQLVATGLTNREIAQQLTISPNTVKVHLRNIFDKIEASSRTEATMYGIEHGFVDVPGGDSNKIQLETMNARRNYSWILFSVIVLIIVFLVIFRDRIFLSPSNRTTDVLESYPERWQELAAMPEPRSNMASIAFDGNIFVVAGEESEGVCNDVIRYNTINDHWDILKEKPTPVADIQGVLIGAKIYVPGGRLENGHPTDILEVYDIRIDEWEHKTPLPIKVSGYALVAYEGQMYLFGGWDGEKALDVVMRYDPVDDSWEEAASMPTARAYAGAAAVGGKIYVVGGWDGEQALDKNESYTPTKDLEGENAWEIERELPESGYSLGVESMAGMVFVVADSGVWQYSVGSENWNLDDSQTLFKYNYGSGYSSLESYLFVIGGSDSENNKSNRVSRYQAIYSFVLPIIKNQ
jgi:DNA-binding CsgD family transcriptional regulator